MVGVEPDRPLVVFPGLVISFQSQQDLSPPVVSLGVLGIHASSFIELGHGLVQSLFLVQFMSFVDEFLRTTVSPSRVFVFTGVQGSRVVDVVNGVFQPVQPVERPCTPIKDVRVLRIEGQSPPEVFPRSLVSLASVIRQASISKERFVRAI